MTIRTWLTVPRISSGNHLVKLGRNVHKVGPWQTMAKGHGLSKLHKEGVTKTYFTKNGIETCNQQKIKPSNVRNQQHQDCLYHCCFKFWYTKTRRKIERTNCIKRKWLCFIFVCHDKGVQCCYKNHLGQGLHAKEQNLFRQIPFCLAESSDKQSRFHYNMLFWGTLCARQSCWNYFWPGLADGVIEIGPRMIACTGTSKMLVNLYPLAAGNVVSTQRPRDSNIPRWTCASPTALWRPHHRNRKVKSPVLQMQSYKTCHILTLDQAMWMSENRALTKWYKLSNKNIEQPKHWTRIWTSRFCNAMPFGLPGCAFFSPPSIVDLPVFYRCMFKQSGVPLFGTCVRG